MSANKGYSCSLSMLTCVYGDLEYHLICLIIIILKNAKHWHEQQFGSHHNFLQSRIRKPSANVTVSSQHFMKIFLLTFLSGISAISPFELVDSLRDPFHSIIPQRRTDFLRFHPYQNGLPPSFVTDLTGTLSPREYYDLNTKLTDLQESRNINPRVVIVDVSYFQIFCTITLSTHHMIVFGFCPYATNLRKYSF